MAKKSGWKRGNSKTVYKGRVHIVEHQAVLPNGEPTTYEVDHSETCAVAVLIRTANHEIILSYQYRFPLDSWIYDLPGGAKKNDETPEEAAIRECQEEVGVKPGNIELLRKFYMNPARTDWPAYVYFCKDFEESSIDLGDPSENVERVVVGIDELEEMINNGEVVDPMLLIGWYSAKSKGYL